MRSVPARIGLCAAFVALAGCSKKPSPPPATGPANGKAQVGIDEPGAKKIPQENPPSETAGKGSDVKVFAAQVSEDFSKFTPEQIAELLNETRGELDHPFVARYQNYLIDLRDIDYLVRSLNLLNSAPYKEGLLQQVFRRSKLLAPGNLKALIAVCKTGEEKQQLAIGLKSQLDKLPDDQRMATAQKYLDTSDDDMVSRAVVQAATKALVLNDVALVESWLQQLPPEIVSGGDQELLKYYASKEPLKGAAFVQKLIDAGQESRGWEALESFADSYAAANPLEAMRWARALPDSLEQKKYLALLHAYARLSERDKRAASEELGQLPREMRERILKHFHPETNG